MGQRSRKRGRREKAAPREKPAPTMPASTPRAAAAQAPASATVVVTATEATPQKSRSEARNQAARAALVPLAPGERPWAVTLSAILAAAFGGYNLVMFLLGTKLSLDGKKPGTAGVLLFALVMFTCAVGMWRLRYWAVLGFQALLAFTLLILARSLILVSNLEGLAICVGGLSAGGFLFYKLVRALSRIQLPVRERR